MSRPQRYGPGKLREDLCGREPDNLRFRHELAYSLFYVARLKRSLRNPEQAKPLLTQAVKILKQMIADEVGFGSLRSDLEVVQSLLEEVELAI